MSIQFDADSIKQRLKDRLRSKSSWANILFFSTNQRLIDAVAEEIADDMQYDEILTRETKWGLARQISSLMAEVKFFNYYPNRKIGASGLLRVSTSQTFNQSYGYNISIPKYSIFSVGDTNVCSTESDSLLQSQNYKDISIIQGIPKFISFTASGKEFETFTVFNDSIDNNVFDVYVNNEIYETITDIREADGPTSKQCVISNLKDFSGVEIKFGNDYFGKKLSTGDIVDFYYVETRGGEGDIISSNTINTVVSTFYDSVGDEVQLYCTNNSALSGGQNYEDIEDIRAKAPKAYKAGDTAITKDDYQSMFEDFSFIKKTKVWGEAEINEDRGNLPGTFIEQEENVVHACLISTDNVSITPYQEQVIRQEINEKKSPTDIIVFETPNFLYINFTVNAYITDRSYAITNVTNNIISTLENDYSIDSLDFKTPIYQSDYVSRIKQVAGVGYHITTFNMYKFESFTSNYVADININLLDITPGSLRIYVKNTLTTSLYTLIGQDNGTGDIVGVGDVVFENSEIEYSNGLGNILITSGLSESYQNYLIKIVFALDDDNILPQLRNQFVSYGSSTVTVSYD
jgi:hypothetical protein